jgi:hypothetical protein
MGGVQGGPGQAQEIYSCTCTALQIDRLKSGSLIFII